MSPILSSEGEKINWINYKTNEKDISFPMEADNSSALIAIELRHTDDDIRQIYFEQFVQLKNIFHESLKEEWNWQFEYRNENGKISSRIFKQITGSSILNREDWPGLISFFKPRIIALDEFWCSVKYSFEMLR